MRPIKIPNAVPFNAPKDWDPQLDGDVQILWVRKGVDLLSGSNTLTSVWFPSAEDILHLMGGGGVSLKILGNGHPVVGLNVISPEDLLNDNF